MLGKLTDFGLGLGDELRKKQAQQPPQPQSPGGGASDDLGLGDMLRRQSGMETDELKRRQLANKQMLQRYSPAAQQLFGKMGGGLDVLGL